MAQFAVLILASPRIASSSLDLAFQPIAGVSLVRRLALRLEQGLAKLDATFVLTAPESPRLCSRVKAELAGTRFKVVPVDGTSQLEWLSEVVSRFPGLQTLLLFHELACFPDLTAALDMVENHARHTAHVTISPQAPEGLLPVIIDADAIQKLAALELPGDLSADVVAVFRMASRLCADESGMRFRINMADPYASAGFRSGLLPSHLLITDAIRRRAAAAVAMKSDIEPTTTRTEAEWFKRELVASTNTVLLPSPRVDAPARSRPRRVLFVSYIKGFSGAEASWAALITTLNREQFQPLVVLPNPSALSELLTAAGVEVEIAEWDFTRPSPANISYFCDLLRNRVISLVDVNCNAGLPVLLAAKLSRLPVVTHVRFYNAVSMQDLLEFSDRIVAVSDSVREDAMRCDIPAGRFATIYNGINQASFVEKAPPAVTAKALLGLTAGTPTALMVARIDPAKKYELFLLALERLRAAGTAVTGLCLGEAYLPHQAYFRQLKEIAARMGPQGVRWLPFTLNPAPIHAAADVLVICNPTEPLPRCAIEACALGVPIVAPRAGGCLEIVSDGYNGLLFEPDDLDSLTTALHAVLADPSLRTRLSTGARETAARFDIVSHVAAMEGLFEELLLTDPLDPNVRLTLSRAELKGGVVQRHCPVASSTGW